ncbi:hypothetical protein J4405_01100 [Candidatus Woesearchaeota archaeon]|nr:hypothetical protein [Candidatus Woesearchaeota archaeon]
MLNKKGMQFIWIFSLVAGVIIIFLFTSFAMKYKDLQERKTDFEIVNNLNNAFQKLGNEEISVSLNFVKETSIRCGVIQIKGSPDSHKTDKIIFAGDRLKDNTIVWQSNFNYPFKIANFYYVVDKDAKFNLQDESLLEKIPDSLKSNFNSLTGRKIFFNKNLYTKGKDNYYVDVNNKIVENLDAKYKYYNDEMLLGILIGENQKCLLDEIDNKIKEISSLYFEKVASLKDCEYSNALKILNEMKELKNLDENFDLLEKENRMLIGMNCVGIY